MVNTVHKDGGSIFGRGRDDCLFGTTLDVLAGGLSGSENSGGLSNVVGTSGAPLDLGGVGFLEDSDEVTINLDATFDFLDGEGEAS